jgi:DNA-binding transcriptional regulator YhcF (GntR family)
MIDTNLQMNIIKSDTSIIKEKSKMQTALKSCEFSQIELTNKLIENLSNFSMLKKSSQAVLIRLTRYYNAKKEAEGKSSIYPSEKTLANNCNVSERTVKRAIKELKDNNLILVIKSNKRYSVNHYKLTNIFFEMVQMSPAKGQNVPSIGDKMSPKQRKLTNKIKKIYIKKFKNSIRFKELSRPAILDTKQPKALKYSSFSNNISSIYTHSIYYVIFDLFQVL